MAYWLTAFDGTSLPTNLGDRGSMDVAAGVASSPLISLPGGRVYDPNGSTTTYRPSAQFTATVLLVGSAATRQTQFEVWQAKIGVVGVLTRTGDYGSTGGTQTINARLISASVNRVVAHYQHQLMTLVFQVASFPWKGTASVPVLTSATISGATVFVTVTNNGNVTYTKTQLLFTPIGGAMTSLLVGNGTTGQSFTYTGAVAAGTSLSVDVGARTVLNNSVGDYAHFTPSAGYEEWFSLAPGANAMYYQPVFGAGHISAILSIADAWA